MVHRSKCICGYRPHIRKMNTIINIYISTENYSIWFSIFLRLRRNFVEKIQSSRHIVISYLVRQMDLDIVEATAVMADLEKSGLIQIQPSGELEIKEWGGIS